MHRRKIPSKPVFQMMSLKWLLILNCELSMFAGAVGWTYHSSENIMNWTVARNWCKTEYTDMVAIQNQEENLYLNQTLDKRPNYYWLGIRKLNDTWTWVGTQKTLINEFSNWASNEPNNRQGEGEDCVEIYIKRESDGGKWNDDPCSNSKFALCYKAHCNNETCNSRSECRETINNYTCICKEGFIGPQCQAVQCGALTKPVHGYINCSGPYGSNSFNSTCQFHCLDGFSLNGSNTITCTSSGNWTGAAPTCQAVQCGALSKPAHGHIDYCEPYGNNSVNSTCQFRCLDGFSLNGSKSITCSSSGKWTGEVPVCKGVECELQSHPDNGVIQCLGPNGNHSFNSTCEFHCMDGFLLLGPTTITCGPSGIWTGRKPICADYEYFIMAVIGASIIASSCIVLLLLTHCRKRKKHLQKRMIGASAEEVEVPEEKHKLKEIFDRPAA
ncbi:L-selectin-like isoform X1 [Lepisosteus oculatus]|uniref:L-selectin-like isoform X1 n=2 Tax=Lepisosteus oculatus TaxID=7918 RepID=UPI003716B5C5